MGNNKHNIKPLPLTSFSGLDKETSNIITKQAPVGQLTRLTVDVDQELAETFKDYSYYRGMTQKEALLHILKSYFQENCPPKRPEEVRERAAQRIDRRRRNYKV